MPGRHGIGRSRQIDAEYRPRNELDQAAAVEAPLGVVTAESIGHAKVAQRLQREIANRTVFLLVRNKIHMIPKILDVHKRLLLNLKSI